jgi:hypothetical protein
MLLARNDLMPAGVQKNLQKRKGQQKSLASQY